MRRRRFLYVAASAATVSCGRAPSPWRFFTAAEARTLTALTEQLIPADQDPGAGWAGVVRFIDRQLAGRWRGLQKTYREGLAQVDRTSRERCGAPFVELPAERQAEVLAALEKERFFQTLLSHTMQGFYGDPRHGGNREAVSWKMLGVPYPPIRGRVT